MNLKDTFFSKKQTLNFRGVLAQIDSPLVMGILNVTPDSFYDGGRHNDEEGMKALCARMLDEGASIIDIGAYSSRPGAENISEEAELDRFVNALKILRRNFGDILISVDTFRARIAEVVVKEFGVQMINDISAGLLDEEMLPMVGRLKVPYVMMHMPGNPQTMAQNTQYSNLVNDLLFFFGTQIRKALESGIDDVIIDPGFGFGKTLEQNFRLLSHLKEFRILETLILVGVSRKSMIFRTIGKTPDEALAGTIAAETLALLGGADILRVHDVKEAIDAMKIVKAFQKG